MFRKKCLPFLLVLAIAMAAALAACGGGSESGSAGNAGNTNTPAQAGSMTLDTAGLTLGREVTTVVRNLTEQLGGIHDLASAQAALPQLQGMDTKLNELATKASSLTPESKDALSGMVKGVMPELEAQVAKLGDMPGVGTVVMPTVNSLLSKVRSLT